MLVPNTAGVSVEIQLHQNHPLYLMMNVPSNALEIPARYVGEDLN
jgi:hypothetical protein